eukprot:Selendium_serpulae@DN6435_c1_g1_i2.p1
MEHNDKHIYAHHNAAITGGDAGADVDLFGSVRIYHDNGKKLECAEDADTSEPLEGFSELNFRFRLSRWCPAQNYFFGAKDLRPTSDVFVRTSVLG